MLPLALLLSIFMMAKNAASAELQAEQPLWEVGIAAGAATLPQYMGSDERYFLAAPIPYLIYRGERLKIDRSGISSELFGIRDLSMDVSLGIGLPVKNSNRARANMPALKFSLQVGPRLNWKLYEDTSRKLTLRLPYRAAINTAGNWLGWVSEPDITLQYQSRPDLNIKLTAGALFGSRLFHQTYYGVNQLYATPARAVYQASAGLHSLSLSTRVRYNLSDSLTLFSAIRYRNLSAGTVANSPLVKDHDYLSATIGVTWSFWMSEQMVVTE